MRLTLSFQPLPYRLLAVFLLTLLLVGFAAPIFAAEALGDPVLDGILDMLEADLSDTLILDWLATVEEAPRTPTAGDMIALRRAGASDALMHGLLDKARGELETPPANPAAAPLESPPPESPPTGAAQPSSAGQAPPSARPSGNDFRLGSRPFDPPTASEAAQMVPAGRGATTVSWAISNQPYWLEGEEPWSLFIYLNGEPVTYVAESSLFADRVLRFSKLVTPGKQRLLVFREQHDGDANRHMAKVMPQKIEFSLEPGGVAEIELTFKQTVVTQSDPLSFRVTQNGRFVAESSDIGGNPDTWDFLCEDLERTLGDDRDDSRLKDCVRWQDLWATEGGPTRSQVLQAYANFDYRPVPREQSLH